MCWDPKPASPMAAVQGVVCNVQRYMIVDADTVSKIPETLSPADVMEGVIF